jgi:PBSX family phage terminase large subunit
MSTIARLAILNEIKRRREEESNKSTFTFDSFAFAKQKEFFKLDGSRFRTAVCSRRSGKTVGIAADMLDTCLSEPGITCLYITLTRDNVRRIIWGDIQRIIEEYKIPCKLDNLRLEIKFPNGSRVITGGAKDKTEIEKFRGLKLKKVYIDEAQSMRDHIKELINDVLIPALRDLRGTMYLSGTPGPVKAGAFYEYSHNEHWHNICWTAYENPFMHNPKLGVDLNYTLSEERKIRGIDETDASYRRETFGEWVEDKDALVIKYDDKVNDYNLLPASKFDYILGIDVGFEDSDAIAVLAYSYDTNEVYLVEEVEKNKQDITALAEEIHKLKNKYKPVNMVMDAGALGKKIQEELRLRHALCIEAADKTRKLEHLEFLNSDLRRGILRIKKNSLFAQDSKLVTWDRSDPEKPKISSTYHSDILDAVLYAYMLCRHYIKQDFVARHDKFSTAYMDEQERKESERMQRMVEDPEMFAYEEGLSEDAETIEDFFGGGIDEF